MLKGSNDSSIDCVEVTVTDSSKRVTVTINYTEAVKVSHVGVFRRYLSNLSSAKIETVFNGVITTCAENLQIGNINEFFDSI